MVQGKGKRNDNVRNDIWPWRVSGGGGGGLLGFGHQLTPPMHCWPEALGGGGGLGEAIRGSRRGNWGGGVPQE